MSWFTVYLQQIKNKYAKPSRLIACKFCAENRNTFIMLLMFDFLN